MCQYLKMFPRKSVAPTAVGIISRTQAVQSYFPAKKSKFQVNNIGRKVFGISHLEIANSHIRKGKLQAFVKYSVLILGFLGLICEIFNISLAFKDIIFNFPAYFLGSSR